MRRKISSLRNESVRKAIEESEQQKQEQTTPEQPAVITVQPRRNARSDFAMSLIGRGLLVLSFFFLFWCLFPLTQGKSFDVYINSSLFNWILFMVTLVMSAFVETVKVNADVRKFFTTIERGQKVPKGQTSANTDQAKTKNSPVQTNKKKLPL